MHVLKRLFILAFVAAVIGLGVFWWLTIPVMVAASTLPPHTPNPGNGAVVFNAGGCSSCHATPAQQDALLTLAMNDQIPGGAKFFEPFRQLVIVGYFTSEVGITQEREYLPVPGEYNGEFLYSKVNKVYSS
jgi:hypothetical protein